MIIVKLMGGLGNQMFQYAFSRELAAMYGEEVYYDLESYQADRQRKLSLLSLSVPELPDWKTVLSESERKRITREQKLYRIEQRAMRAIHRSDRVGEKLYNRYIEKNRYYNFDPYYYGLPKLSGRIKAAYGYFQGEAYFVHVIDEIRRAFAVSEEISDEQDLLEQIRSCNSVCVHIRVGDYKARKNRRFDVVNPDYVRRGLDYLREKVTNPVFFVFTNDPESVRRDYGIPDAIYVTGLRDVQDFRLMQACRHFLISNSTFSWWASYLAASPDRLIVVPEKWRRNQESDPALLQSCGLQYIKR